MAGVVLAGVVLAGVVPLGGRVAGVGGNVDASELLSGVSLGCCWVWVGVVGGWVNWGSGRPVYCYDIS